MAAAKIQAEHDRLPTVDEVMDVTKLTRQQIYDSAPYKERKITKTSAKITTEMTGSSVQKTDYFGATSEEQTRRKNRSKAEQAELDALIDQQGDDEEIRAIAAEKNERIDTALLKSRKVGKYGIRIESSSSSPTARYANFTSILEIARLFPEQVDARVVVEHSDLPNKEVILQQLPQWQVSETRKSADAVSSLKQKRKDKLATSKDFVNTIKQP